MPTVYDVPFRSEPRDDDTEVPPFHIPLQPVRDPDPQDKSNFIRGFGAPGAKTSVSGVLARFHTNYDLEHKSGTKRGRRLRVVPYFCLKCGFVWKWARTPETRALARDPQLAEKIRFILGVGVPDGAQSQDPFPSPAWSGGRQARLLSVRPRLGRAHILDTPSLTLV
jgi:hypothetical protein